MINIAMTSEIIDDDASCFVPCMGAHIYVGTLHVVIVVVYVSRPASQPDHSGMLGVH